MGRTFENRKAAIFARSDRISKIFARIGREIVIAVRQGGGTTPETNSALKRVLANARAVSMPKDTIEAAIKRATGEGGDNYDEVIYEGYAPHGIAMLVVTATDNPTRTVANVRSHFNKCGGSLGNSGSVGFLFNKMGVFRLKPDGINREELELELIDFGLEELAEGTGEKGEAQLIVRCAFTDFGKMAAAIEARKLTVMNSGAEHIPMTSTELTDAQVDDVMKLIERLENDDDVQGVFHNME